MVLMLKTFLTCVKNSVKSIIDSEYFMAKLVGFGSDGASVNAGKKEGVKSLIQHEKPWIIFEWCIAHRLELALKDGLKGTGFHDINDLILKMYYLYKRSPKKLRQLKELVEIYSDSFDILDRGVKPKKALGTWWIAHKTRGLILSLINTAFLCSIWKICPKISHIQQKKDNLLKVGTINGRKLAYHYWPLYLWRF